MIKSTVKNKEDFKAIVELAMQQQGYSHMRAVVEKELLHYDILFALEKERLLDTLTFQGGTSLRLCYDASCFSEDLDFTGGKDFNSKKLFDMKNCIQEYIGKRYGLEISVKEPKENAQENRDIKVSTWQISITTSPDRKDLPKQKIKIEICNVPSYTRSPLPLKTNYNFLPDDYTDTLIMTEDLNEIMADKLVSLVSTTSHVRNRDIWDLQWLRKRGASINVEFVQSKIKDYGIDDYLLKLKKMIENIDNIVTGQNFENEITRFLPQDVLDNTLHKDKFKLFLSNEIRRMLLKIRDTIENPMI